MKATATLIVLFVSAALFAGCTGTITLRSPIEFYPAPAQQVIQPAPAQQSSIVTVPQVGTFYEPAPAPTSVFLVAPRRCFYRFGWWRCW